MSITSPVPDSNGIVLTAIGMPCFFCGEQLHAAAVHWNGDPGSIYLHPGCVVELTIRLYRDLHELEARTGAYLAKST